MMAFIGEHLEEVLVFVFIAGIFADRLAQIYCDVNFQLECKKLREENAHFMKLAYNNAMNHGWEDQLRFLLHHGFDVSFLHNGSAWHIVAGDMGDDGEYLSLYFQCDEPHSDDDGASLNLLEVIRTGELKKSDLRRELKRLMKYAKEDL